MNSRMNAPRLLQMFLVLALVALIQTPILAQEWEPGPSPYVEEINNLAIDFLTRSGFETTSRAGVAVALDNYGQGEMTPEAVFELGRRADSAEAEALVLSCTDMRSVETLERLEQVLGKPVISSNQAMIFSALTHLGLPFRSDRCGRLLNGIEVT